MIALSPRTSLLILSGVLSLAVQACGGGGSNAGDGASGSGTLPPDPMIPLPAESDPEPPGMQTPSGPSPDGPVRPPSADDRPGPSAGGCDPRFDTDTVVQSIAALDTLPISCSSPLGDALIARVDGGQVSAPELVELLLDSLDNSAEEALPLKLQLLQRLLGAYGGQLDDSVGQRTRETLVAVLVEHPGSGSGYPYTAIRMLTDFLSEQCASPSGPPDCLDAAAAVFESRNDRYTRLAAVHLYRSVLLTRTSLGEGRAERLAALVADDDPSLGAEGATIAAELFFRTLVGEGGTGGPPDFALDETETRLLTSALVSVFDDALVPAESAIRTANVAHALHWAHVLVLPQPDRAALFAGLPVPVETIERHVRLGLEEAYLMPAESCTYTSGSGRTVSVQLHLPKNPDARAVAEVRDCETYRAADERFLDTVGEAFGSRSSDVPDTDPLIYYFEDMDIHALYLQRYLQAEHLGGLFQREWSVTGETRHNAMYFSGGVASRHVAAHEYAHYLHGRHVLPTFPVHYSPMTQMINEGLAEYIAHHAFAGPEPPDSNVSRVCDYPRPYPTLRSILDGDSFGLDYDLAYVYVHFLIEREPATFRKILTAIRQDAPVELVGTELVVGDGRFDAGALDASLHALFDSDAFCG